MLNYTINRESRFMVINNGITSPEIKTLRLAVTKQMVR